MIDLPNYPVSAMIKKKALLLATLFLASAAPTLTGIRCHARGRSVVFHTGAITLGATVEAIG